MALVALVGCVAQPGAPSGTVPRGGNDGGLADICSQPVPDADVFDEDARWYADAFDVSLAEARLRLALQGVEGIGAAGQDAAPDLWAGAWLEHEPEFGFVLLYKGEPEAVEHVRAATRECVVPVFVRSGARYSEAELLDGMARLSESGRLAPPMPGLSMHPDVGAGVIVLEGPIDPGAALAEIEEIAGVPVRYVQADLPTIDRP